MSKKEHTRRIQEGVSNLQAERASYAAYYHNLRNPIAQVVSSIEMAEAYSIQIPGLSKKVEALGFNQARVVTLSNLLVLTFRPNGRISVLDISQDVDPIIIKADISVVMDRVSEPEKEKQEQIIEYFLNNLDNRSQKDIQQYSETILLLLKDIFENTLKKLQQAKDDITDYEDFNNTEAYEFTEKALNETLPNAIKMIELSLLIFDPDIGKTILKSSSDGPVNDIVTSSLKRIEQTNMVVYEESGIVVYSNPDVVSLALENYLTNAIKYAERESVENAKVEITSLQHDNFTAIAVTDNGGGLDENDYGKVFAPGKQADGAIKSTGVGLWMVAKLVKAHKSIYGVTSVKGEGSTFYLAVPNKEKEITETDKENINNWASKLKV